MPSLELARRRMESVTDLREIVRVMKSLSAVRIRQCREAVDAMAEYASTVELGLRAALFRRDQETISRPEPPKATVVIGFGSDQGLVGAFNRGTSSLTLKTANELGGSLRATLVVGFRLARQLESAGHLVDDVFSAPPSPDALTPAVQDLILAIDDWRANHGVERFVLCYNDHEPREPISPRAVQLLPLDDDWLASLARVPWPTRVLPTYSVPWRGLFAALVREQLFVSLFRALAASLASENAYRLSAMEAAEQRIDEHLTELEHDYRQQRQQQITEELLEVTAGFEALLRSPRRGL